MRVAREMAHLLVVTGAMCFCGFSFTYQFDLLVYGLVR